MRKPITPYSMNVYEININNVKEISTPIEIEYREITQENLNEVASLRNNTRLKEFKKLISQNLSIGIAAYYNGQAIGYGWGKMKGSHDKFFSIKNTEAYLSSFFVLPDFRGYSLYPCLITHLMEKINIIHGTENFKIAIDKDNIPSIKGVKKVGFSFVKQYRLFRVLKVTVPKFMI